MPKIQLSPESVAIGLLMDDPTLKKDEIAAKLGVNKSTVSRWETFGRLYDAYSDAGNTAPVRRRASRLGSIDIEYEHAHLNQIDKD